MHAAHHYWIIVRLILRLNNYSDKNFFTKRTWALLKLVYLNVLSRFLRGLNKHLYIALLPWCDFSIHFKFILLPSNFIFFVLMLPHKYCVFRPLNRSLIHHFNFKLFNLAWVTREYYIFISHFSIKHRVWVTWCLVPWCLFLWFTLHTNWRTCSNRLSSGYHFFFFFLFIYRLLYHLWYHRFIFD